MIVKVVVPDSIYAKVYFARGEQGPQGVTGNTGPQGPSGIVNVDSPITNSGTTTAANIGLNQALIQIAPAQVTGTAVITTDSRLSDQRVPTDGSVTDTKIVAGGLSPNRITGTAVITTDSRLSDARTPLAHAASHGSAGSDPVTLAQSQVTNLVSDLAGKASTTHASTHGSAGSDPVTIAQSQVTGLTSALAAKAPLDSPVFTTKVTLPVTSGTFLGTNSLGEIYKVGGAPGLGYIPYTASVGGGIAWLDSTLLTRDDQANTFTVGGHVINNNAVGTVPLLLKGFSGQTGDLLQIQNNGGTNLAVVSSTGTFRSAGLITAGDVNNVLGQLSVYTTVSSRIGAVIRGAASQSANLQEWQNSAGTVLGFVTSSGVGRFEQVQINSGYASLAYSSSGGSLRLVKKTAAQANIGANIGDIYFRDGTNAGTLKLVVRAGAAGAETTILDNIPQ